MMDSQMLLIFALVSVGFAPLMIAGTKDAKRHRGMVFIVTLAATLAWSVAIVTVANRNFDAGVYAAHECWASIDTLSNRETVVTTLPVVRENTENGVSNRRCIGLWFDE